MGERDSGLRGWGERCLDVAVSQPELLNLESTITTKPLHLARSFSTQG